MKNYILIALLAVLSACNSGVNNNDKNALQNENLNKIGQNNFVMINPVNNATNVSTVTKIHLLVPVNFKISSSNQIKLFSTTNPTLYIPIKTHFEQNVLTIEPQKTLATNTKYVLRIVQNLMIMPFSFTTMKSLDNNYSNFVFVQNMEQGNLGNLSIIGFNHSLVFGRFLFSILNNNLTNIYTVAPSSNITNNISNISSLQTIENFALLYQNYWQNNSGSISPTLLNNNTSDFSYINQIIQQSNIGQNNVFVMSATEINYILSQLAKINHFVFTPIKNNSHQLVILSLDSKVKYKSKTINDGIVINSDIKFPSTDIPLKNMAKLSCPQGVHSYSFKLNSQLQGYSINKNETVYLIRHVEAHPYQINANSRVENGNYVCKGQQRALGVTDRLFQIIGRNPDLVFGPSTSGATIVGYYYIRPSLSITPFTIAHNIPLNIIPASILTYGNANRLADYLFTNRYRSDLSGKTILVSWESNHATSAVKDLIQNIFQKEIPKDFPDLSLDYDTVFKVSLDSNGNMTFNSTCEGVMGSSNGDENPYLSSQCPFF